MQTMISGSKTLLMLGFVALSASVSMAQSSSHWFTEGGGDWSNSANWSNGVPNGAGAGASIFFASSGNGSDFAKVTLPQPLVLQSLLLKGHTPEVAFGSVGDVLHFGEPGSFSFNYLEVDLFGGGRTDFLPRIEAGDLEVGKYSGAIRLVGSIDALGQVAFGGADSTFIEGDVAAQSFALGAAGGGNGGRTGLGGDVEVDEHLTISVSGGEQFRTRGRLEGRWVDFNGRDGRGGRYDFEGLVVARTEAVFEARDADLSIAEVDAPKVSFNGYGGDLSVGLGGRVEWVTFQREGLVRVTSLGNKFDGRLRGRVDGVFDVVTDLADVKMAELEVGTLRLSGGGRFEAAQVNSHAPPAAIELAGGELVVSRNEPVSLSAVSATRGQSEISFGQSVNAEFLEVASLEVASDAAVVVGRTGTGGDAEFSVVDAPDLIGSGSAGTNTVGIVGGVFYDSSASESGTGFATYDSVKGRIRPLTDLEYSDSFTAGANVKLGTGNHVKSAPGTLNSLVLDGGAELRFAGAGLNVVSGMVVSTGGSKNVISAGGGGQRLANQARLYHFFTEIDLDLNVGVIGELVKSGDGRLTYRAGGPGTDRVVVNRGTLGGGGLSAISKRGGEVGWNVEVG